MRTLAIVPTLRGYVVAPGRVRLTQKFAEGMAKYAELWPGKVIAAMLPDSAAESGNLDDRVYAADELNFEVRIVSGEKNAIFAALEDADAVMLSPDHRLSKLTRWCKAKGKKTIFVTEYSLETRYQIIRSNTRNPLLRLRRYFWEAQEEFSTRRKLIAADAIQCNGTPTFDAYHKLNRNTLLFFDSRITDSMLASDASVKSRFRNLQNGEPIRLAFSGRLLAMKGADHLLDVAKNLRAAGIPFRMDIFGDGPLLPSMEEQIRTDKLEQHVSLCGVLDFATELMPYVRDNVDLFVCCHRQGDPSCTYLETFACGVPIAGYANEAFRGLAENRLLGWTTPMNRPDLLANKIVALYRQPQDLLVASLNALEFARQHTFEHEFGARINQIEMLFHNDLPEEFRTGSFELASERLRSLVNQKSAARLQTRAMVSSFPPQAEQRLLLVSLGARIPQSQIFPFHFFAGDLQRHYGAAVREVAIERVLDGSSAVTGATTVAFQTEFDIDTAELAQLITHLQQHNPGARMVYLDWTAPTDLRNAERLNSLVDVYVKKHVLRDRSLYGHPTLGDTNLSDYYARRANLSEQEYCFKIPSDFMSKLLVGPSFVTAPALLPALRKPFNARSEREIDLHARFDANGTPWYGVMRGEAEIALAEVNDLRLAAGFGIPRHRFISELRHSKVCFSPFGYGEVCWRDYEAIMAGAVLLKPDTGHVETQPDIFLPWETYVPLRWDLMDLNETLRRLLKDSELRQSIAERAYAVLHDYLNSDAFARQMQPLFTATN